jgi:hypothetical protein
MPEPFNADELAAEQDKTSDAATPPPQQQGSYLQEGLAGPLRALKGMYSGFWNTLHHPSDTLDQFADQTKAMFDAGAKSHASGENLAGSTLAGLEQAPVIGPLVRRAEQAGPGYAKFEPATLGAVTEGATYALAPELARKALGGMEKFAKRKDYLADPVEAGKHVANAVNPGAKLLPNLIENLTPENISRIKAGGTVESLSDLERVAREQGDKAREVYVKQVLEPDKGEIVPIPKELYDGKTVGDPGTRATLGDIEKRLADINKTQRNPQMLASEGARRAGIGKNVDLAAEAQALREIIYREHGIRHGLSPDQVRAMREPFGQLENIADDAKEAIARNQTIKNVESQEGTRIGGALTPYGPHASVRGGFRIPFTGTNPDAMIKDAFSRVQVQPASEPAIAQIPKSHTALHSGNVKTAIPPLGTDQSSLFDTGGNAPVTSGNFRSLDRIKGAFDAAREAEENERISRKLTGRGRMTTNTTQQYAPKLP